MSRRLYAILPLLDVGQTKDSINGNEIFNHNNCILKAGNSDIIGIYFKRKHRFNSFKNTLYKYIIFGVYR